MAEDATQLLTRVAKGDSSAIDRLLPSVYGELRALADALLVRERPGHTLQATALVNEAYLRLVKQDSATWQDRAHFFAVAAQAMRRILVDHARQRNRNKRGGGHDRVPLDSALLILYETSAGADMEALNTALMELSAIRPRAAKVIDMRFFAGMTAEEIAGVLESSVSTVEREWRYARAWLKCALGGAEFDAPGSPHGATSPRAADTANHEHSERTTGG
ncbi:MAG: sigma-70 family RNA polymerase sigma factor [Phycisphaerales bacterium]|nr:sigma-70 family RNA polymerase sigma factor [Phycisphaerales bacterium]MCI0630000.1 sigma-70 family RNA polymerase sigma factor [Phycisphaerales bacterium]MCI0677230.1 sigma-70 family RNA polymerase sigma factor [Phycisphaerales bacterium]